MVTEEVDKEEAKNWTTNPMVGNREVLGKKIDEANQSEPEDTHILMTWVNEMEDEVWINAKTSNSIEFQLQHGEWKEGLSLEEQIPMNTWMSSMRIRQTSQSWDHKIELKEGFQLKLFKSYNLTPEEQIELDKFLKDNLEKEYI